MKKNLLVISLLAVGISLSSCEQKNNQQEKSVNSAATGPVSINALSPKEFAKRMYKGNMFEVKMGVLAEKRSKNADVKQFAQRMQKDHSQAQEELKKIAQKENIELPTEMSGEQSMKYTEFEKKSTKRFDKDYSDLMVKEHTADVEYLQKAVKELNDPEMKSYAQKTLPILEEHLKLAKSLNQKITESPKASTK